MNTLTKILIVALSLLCVVAAVLFIQLSVGQANYRQAYEQKDAAWEVAKAQAQQQTQVANLAKQALDALAAQKETGDRDAATEIDRLNTENARLQAENARLVGQQEAQSASLVGLKASVEQQTQMNELLTRQLDERNAVVQDLTEQHRRTTLQAQELARDLETARQNVSVKTGLLAAAESKILDLEQRLARAGTGTRLGDPAPVPTTVINGRVTAVDAAHQVAQLNVGSADGVAEGMLFILYRGTEFVGELKVAQVQPNDCAGLLSNLQRQPQPQDKATTNLDVE
ncbi:MAG: hypothetical protein GX591_04415 [Planctomycetes bacterium]|nr:hypothetical protein [Planctomycetota bacterium]